MTTPAKGEEPEGRTTETPEVGLVADEELPVDLRPSEDNPLAQDPDDTDGAADRGDAGDGGPKVEGMPDVGDPGAPA